jgi:carboxymethylenebutenolidase
MAVSMRLRGRDVTRLRPVLRPAPTTAIVAIAWALMTSAAAGQGRDDLSGLQISVVGEEVAYGTGENGEPLHGYLAYPGEEPHRSRPAILVIHDWRGLDDNVRGLARRLAAEEFTVLAVDLFGGKAAATADSAAAYVRSVQAHPRAALSNIELANAFVRYTRGAHRVATLGWSFGGEWSLREALFDAKHVHAVVVYDSPLVFFKREDLARLRGPLLGIYAGADDSIPQQNILAFKRELDALGKTAIIKIYDTAKGGFPDPRAAAYDSTAADDAWQRTTAFLNRYLRG